MEKKILVADDSPSIRKMAELSLRSRKFSVISAKDGQEAFEFVCEERFDVIILDINMPRMDGLELLRKIKSDKATSSQYVIMLTTEGQDEDKQKAISLGAGDYIVKPFKPSEIIRLVEKYFAETDQKSV